MTDFTVTVSAMNNASGATKNQAQAFRDSANALLQATQTLTQAGGGWDDDAAVTFSEKITELKSWCDQMAGIVDTYSEALTKIGTQYNESDQQAASQFKR